MICTNVSILLDVPCGIIYFWNARNMNYGGILPCIHKDWNQKPSQLWVFSVLYISLKGAISMNNSGFPKTESSFLAVSFKDNPSVSFCMKVDFMAHASHTTSAVEILACSICPYKFTGATSFRSEIARQQKNIWKQMYILVEFFYGFKKILVLI